MGLPRPTTDLDQLKADLDEHGYCIVADALSPDEVTALRTRITEQAAASGAALDYYQAEAEGDDVNQWVYQLINKGEEFQNLALPDSPGACDPHPRSRAHPQFARRPHHPPGQQDDAAPCRSVVDAAAGRSGNPARPSGGHDPRDRPVR